VFTDRQDAGERLAARLAEFVTEPSIVLGVPRGGVLVAGPVAAALSAPLDVVVPRKLGAPGNPELGVGAVAPGVRVVDVQLVRRLGVPDSYLLDESARQEAEVERRMTAYRGSRPALDLTGRTAVVVDDGVATGGTAVASIRCARVLGAARVVFAAPVGPSSTIAVLEREADEVLVLETPPSFSAVGEWYERFDQVTDEEVRAVLSATEP
jgi:putative phosphoribosyl transferase